MTYERGEVYREGNKGAHYFSLPKDNLWLGVDPPRGQRSCGGKRHKYTGHDVITYL